MLEASHFDTLVAYTTHFKAGVIRRNGAPNSDQATMTTRFIRHGDLLSMLITISITSRESSMSRP
mgnify:CR=1 FL=1